MGAVGSVLWQAALCPATSLLLLTLVWVWTKLYLGEWDQRLFTASFTDCVQRKQFWRLLLTGAAEPPGAHIVFHSFIKHHHSVELPTRRGTPRLPLLPALLRYIHVHTCTYTRMYIYTHVHMHKYTLTHTHTHTHTHTVVLLLSESLVSFSLIYLSTKLAPGRSAAVRQVQHVYIHRYMYMYKHVHIHIYTHTHTHTHMY
jgi:hypothetical protein